MINKAYFQLFSCCKLVTGYSRSIICDLQKGDFIFIPNEYASLFSAPTGSVLIDTLQENLKLEFTNHEEAYNSIISLFNTLIERGYGRYIDNPESFPPLSTVYERPGLITNAVLDIGEHILYDFDAIAQDLTLLCCKALQIRIFSPIVKDKLYKILDSFRNTSIRSIELCVPFADYLANKSKAFNFFYNLPDCLTVIIHSAPLDIQYSLTGISLIYIKQLIDSEKCCGFVSPYYFKANNEFFSESQTRNSCLNRKLSIDRDGNVKNCPAMETDYGNYATGKPDLMEIVSRQSFDSLQKIKKDDISICQDCEFRYICQDCRAFTVDGRLYSKPLTCGYDPYSATWNE